MRLARAWPAAVLAAILSAPCLAEDGTQAAIPQPQSPCSRGGGQCYSKPELNNVAGVIAKKDDDVPIVQAVLNNPYPQGADVHYPDVQGLAGYFQNEQGIREGAEQALIKYGHYSQDQAETMLKEQPLQARSVIQGLIASGQLPKEYLKQNIGPYWKGGRESMQQIIGAKGPFVMALNNAKNDPIVPMMMKPLGQGSDALPPLTTPGQLQQSQPNNPEAYVDGAQAAAADGDLKGAASQASQALALDPNNQQALDIRGAAEYQLGDKDAARGDATRALKINPNDQTANAILNLGGNVNGSAEVKSPADPFGANPAGIGSLPDGVASKAQWNDRGSASDVKGPAADPGTATLLRDAVGALSVGDSASAERTLNKIIALNGSNKDALNLRALALARQRRYGEALRDAEAVLAKDPKNQTAMNIRSVALNKLKRFSDAAAQARAAIEANPSDGAAYRNLAEALAGLGDRKGALDALKRAAELDARYQGTLDAAVQLPADADLNLLFADDAPSETAVAAARGANAARRPWNLKLLAEGTLAGIALLLVGFWSTIGGGFERIWRKLTRERVVRASEIRYLVEERQQQPEESKPRAEG